MAVTREVWGHQFELNRVPVSFNSVSIKLKSKLTIRPYSGCGTHNLPVVGLVIDNRPHTQAHYCQRRKLLWCVWVRLWERVDVLRVGDGSFQFTPRNLIYKF